MSNMSSLSIRSRLALVALFSATTFYFVYKSRRLSRLFSLSLKTPKPQNPESEKGKIFFISQTGTSKTLAERLHSVLTSNGLAFDLVDPQNYEPEDLPKEAQILIVASTWEDGKPPESAKFFMNWLDESSNDFRVGSLLLRRCKFAVFGVGSKTYEKTFNMVARDLSSKMIELGANEVLPVAEGDMDGGELDLVFDNWSKTLVTILKGGVQVRKNIGNMVVEKKSDCNGGGGGGGGDDDDDDDDDDEVVESEVVDLEDIAGKAPSRKSVNVTETNGKASDGKRDMVTPVIRMSLEKQVNHCYLLSEFEEQGFDAFTFTSAPKTRELN